MITSSRYHDRLTHRQQVVLKVFLESALKAETDTERSLFLNNPFLRQHNPNLYRALLEEYESQK